MANLFIVFLCAIFFLLSGRLIQFVKRIFQIITQLFLRLLSLFGVRIKKKELSLKTSPLFKQTYKDIKTVKKSKQNNKIKSSINIYFLSLLLLSLILIIINLNSVSGNIISKWLFNLQINESRLSSYIFIQSQKDMDTTFTAVMFSILSFSFSKLLTQWKETSCFRKAKREMNLKKKALETMSSKELLDAAKLKDSQEYQELTQEEEDKYSAEHN